MFENIRKIIWPIHGKEVRQYLLIFVVTFLLGVNYHILRNLKYAMLVTAPGAGAEAIPFVQLWGLAPAAIAMTYILARLGRRFSQAQVFYATVGGFLVFFVLFAVFLYPFQKQLEPTRLVEVLRLHLPLALSGLIAIIRYWVYSLFYIAAELWKVSVLAVIFWGYVNSNIELGQAKRFYGPLMLASSLAGVVGGGIVSLFSVERVLNSIGLGRDHWMSVMMTIVIGVAILSLIIFRLISRLSIRQGRSSKQKISFSVREAFQTFRGSRYLMALGFIVASEYIAFTLTELVWKGQLRLLCPDKLAFSAYTGQVVMWASCLSVILSLFMSGSFISRRGWTLSALVPPVVMLVTSASFYLLVFFQGTSLIEGMSMRFFGVSGLVVACFFGATHNCLCRVAKATLRDPTKELAFVPLDPSTQMKGKALIDGVGTHAGRAGGAALQQLLLLIFPTVMAGAPVSALIVLLILGVWLRSARYVGKRYASLASANVEA